MNILKKTIFLTIALALPIFCVGPIIPAQASTPQQPLRVVAYFPSCGIYRNYNVADMPADQLTHINYTFAEIKDNKIVMVDAYAAFDKKFPGDETLPAGRVKGNFHQLQLLKANNPSLKILISVGGWTYSQQFSAMAATEASRKTFAQSAVTLLQTYGFDGIDIDWEFPVIDGLQPGYEQDRNNFTALLKEVRAAFGTKYVLTAAISARPENIDVIDFVSASAYADWFNIMAYDLHGPWDAQGGKVNHQAGLYDIGDKNPELNLNAAVQNMKAAGVPANKIVAGIPFYGRSFAGVSDGILSSFTSAGPGSYDEAGSLDYIDIHDHYLNKNGYTYAWDEKAQAPYLYNKTKAILITFDDARSVAAKTDYAQMQGLGGVMFWTVAMDNGDLVAAITEAKNDGINYLPSQATAQSPDISTDKGLWKYVGTPPCMAGTRLKTDISPSVYYCGLDGRRYVFPNSQTYFTWYTDFNDVSTITSAQMARIPLGGNVTYRLGVKMVKIHSAPKVYAVSKNGTLRWVSSPEIAVTLYGSDWNKKIDDISDAFFVNYKIGEAV